MTKEKEEESVVVRVREPFSDMLLPSSADELAKFMDQPLTAIAETITGALAAGPKAWTPMAGNIIQGILKGRLFQQAALEIKKLRDNGKIPEDYADEKAHKYGFKSWVELFTTIDEETPDADRLEALQAMFYNVNRVNATDGEKIVAYQLFQIAKKLTSGQILYLRASYELFERSAFSAGQPANNTQWFTKVAKELGHDVIGLLDNDLALIAHGLLTPRLNADGSGISQNNAHLSALGIKFCQDIKTYRLETASIEAQ